MRHVRELIGFVFLILCCSGAIGAGKRSAELEQRKSFVRSAPVPAWVVSPPLMRATPHEGPAVLRVADTQVKVDKELSTSYYRAIQANDQDALDLIGQFSVSYIPDYERLLLHQVGIMRAGKYSDQTATAKMQLLRRETQLEAGMLGGQVTLQMLLSDVRVGDILIVRYTITGRNPVFEGRWAGSFAWDSAFPTDHRRLIVSHPRADALHWAQRGDFQTSPIPWTEEVSGTTRKLVFEERDLTVVENEPGTPPEYVPGRLLEFSEYSDWRAVANWAARLFAPTTPTPEMRVLVARFQKEKTPEQRVAAALHWVQDEIRYFSVSLGENSHKPRAPAVVLGTRFGDCKDKALLLVALLRGLGLQAEPVLVSLGAARYPARALPSPMVFDHVIVRVKVEGRDYFVDPTRTGQRESLAQLPGAVPNAAGLVVDVATDAITLLPDDVRSTAQFEIVERFVLPELKGAGTLVAQRIYRGDSASAMRRYFSNLRATTLEKYALSLYEKTYPELRLSATPSVVDDGEHVELVTRYAIPRPLTKTDDRHELAFSNKVLEGMLDLPDKVVRSYPFKLDAGRYRTRHTVEVTWPERSRLTNEVSAKTVDNAFFRYHREYAMQGNTLHYQMDFAGKRDRVSAEEMPQLQAEILRLDKALVGAFHISDATMVDERGLLLRLRDIEGFTMAHTVMTDATPEKSRASPEGACNRRMQVLIASDFLPTGNWRDANLWTQFPPESISNEARRCIGMLAFWARQYAEAIRFWEAAGVAKGDILAPRLAWADFFVGNRRQAQEVMHDHFLYKQENGKDSSKDLIQYVALLLRMGHTLPEELKAQAALDSVSDVWPRPVVAFLFGKFDADALLANARALKGRDAQALALAEASYYIGIRRLAAGDETGANTAFRFQLANGPRATEEYVLSRAEDQRVRDHDPDLVAAWKAEERGETALSFRSYEKLAERGNIEATFSLALATFAGRGTPASPAAAFPIFLRAAESGHADAQIWVGRYFHEGLGGIAQDLQAEGRWFALAAAQNNANGIYNYGMHLMDVSAGLGEQFERGLDYLTQSAGMGKHAAQVRLAKALWPSRPSEALFWSAAAASAGNDEDVLTYARRLCWAPPQLRNKKSAIDLLTPMATRGNVNAQVELGQLYEAGVDGEPNLPLARAWFGKAAEQGSPTGMLRLARIYLHGVGVPQDPVKAAALLTRSTASGEDVPYAHLLLGVLYEEGRGVPKDHERAAFHWQKGGATGLHARTTVGDIYYSGREDRAKALPWYRSASEDGDMLATNNLGDMYENGVGVEQDFEEAMRLYRIAAESGEGMGFLSLASMWASGRAGRIDLRQACLYFAIAARIRGQGHPQETDVRQHLPEKEVRALEVKAARWQVGQPLPNA